MDPFIEELTRLNQVNMLRMTKLETEVMVLKGIVIKDIAKHFDGNEQGVESTYESILHVTLLARLDKIISTHHLLSEDEIKHHLGLED